MILLTNIYDNKVILDEYRIISCTQFPNYTEIDYDHPMGNGFTFQVKETAEEIFNLMK